MLLKVFEVFWYGIQGIIHKFFHDQHGTIGNSGRPVIHMFHQCPDHPLRAPDLFEITVGFTEKFPQPGFPSYGLA